MVAISTFIVLSLFASSSKVSNRQTKKKKKNSIPTTATSKNSEKKNERQVGRRRYNRNGDKITKTNRGNKKGKLDITMDNTKKEEVYPLPQLTTPSSKRPSYFTCRHTYEDTLICEIERYAEEKMNGKISAMSPHPGLVRVDDGDDILPPLYDPTYALQIMPNSVVVSGESIKKIANAIYEALLGFDEEKEEEDRIGDDGGIEIERNTSDKENRMHLHERLRSAPRGSLAIHALVPGMCKGQMKPVMFHRCEKVGEELAKI